MIPKRQKNEGTIFDNPVATGNLGSSQVESEKSVEVDKKKA